MKVNLKCFATLVDAESCNFHDSTVYELEDGQTVEDLIVVAGIEKENVKIAFVNGKKVGFDSVLSDGDRIGLAPATGGM
jgi:molybdopterin converting factor small subunit